MDSERDGYLTLKQAPAYLHSRFNYLISLSTLCRWREKHPLPFPTTAELLDAWFEARMNEKSARKRPH